MHNMRVVAKAGLVVGLMALAACSGNRGQVRVGNAAGSAPDASAPPTRGTAQTQRETIWDLFADRDDPNTTVEVNKYLWNASLDVLSFMPVESSDPFTGVLVFGYGVPPGGGQAYRATVHVSDPALDARGLHVALQTRGGQSVSSETQHKIEDAILHRARQLRVQDINL